MPRVRDGYSDPHDFCQQHFPNMATAERLYGSGEGPDNRGNCYCYDDDHPPYEDEDYRCEVCNRRLTRMDNSIF